MIDEMHVLEHNGTWKLVPPTLSKKPMIVSGFMQLTWSYW